MLIATPRFLSCICVLGLLLDPHRMQRLLASAIFGRISPPSVAKLLKTAVVVRGLGDR